MNAMNIVVPIHLEALRVSPSSSQVAMAALYDFTLLGQQPASALGNLIAANHFESAKASLRQEPGVHLHWSLPRAYTHGVQDETTGAIRYPIVPNRWLVVRFLKDRKKSADNMRIRLWVLESDAHSSEGMEGATPIPWMDDPRNLQGIKANYLGRSFDVAGNWSEAKRGMETTGVGLGAGEVGYLGEMFQATYGYGETFTAYYPNCSNVLGIWDKLDDYFKNPPIDLENDTDFTVSYAVMGWVSSLAADECNVVLNRALDAWQKMAGDKPDFAGYIQGIVEQKLYWSLTSYSGLTPAVVPSAQATLSGILADVEWRIKAPGSPEYPSALPNVDGIQVAVGNNTAEALSAYLNALEQAQPAAGDSDVTTNIEWLLNALQFSQLHTLSAGDVGVGQLEEFLHGTAFTGAAGGYVWAARQKRAVTRDNSKAANNDATLPAHLARTLTQLNEAQRALDKKRDEISTRRKQLFFDWVYHIDAINTNVISGSASIDSDNSGAFVVDGLLQIFPALLSAGSGAAAGAPSAPYAPMSEAFNIALPGDFAQGFGTNLAGYSFNATANAPAAQFTQALLKLGVNADAIASTNLPDAIAALAKAQSLVALYEAGGLDAAKYIADASTLLSVAAAALQAALDALTAFSDATNGLLPLAARLDAAAANLSSYIDPATGVFATALKYTKDPGKAPLPPGETYAGAIKPPPTAVKSWDKAAGKFPGMKAQMDIFAGQNGQPQSLMDIQPAALYLGFAYFYANSGLTFKASAAYYLQMAEQTIEDAATSAKSASATLKSSAAALAGAKLSRMQSDLSQITTQMLPRIRASLSQTPPDAGKAISDIGLLLAQGGSSLPRVAAAATSADWRTMRAGVTTALRAVLERLPLAQQVAQWNQFLYGQISAEFDLTAAPADAFAAPSEPVVMLAEQGAGSGVLAPFLRNGRAARAPCRLSGELVTAVKPIPLPPEIARLSKTLSTGIAGLSDTLQALAEEAFLLSPEMSGVVSTADLKAAAAANESLHYNALHDVDLNDPPPALKGKLPYYIGYNWRDGQDPFLPLYIWWQADYRFSQSYNQDTQSYPPDFLNQFGLGQYQVELQPTAAAIQNFALSGLAPNNFAFHGLISLSGASTSSLCNQIQIYCRTYLDYDPAIGPPDKSLPNYEEAQKFYASYQDYKTRNILSQGLSGFNAGLVQRAQELQIPITIPPAWTATDKFNFPLTNFWPTSFLHNQSADWPVTWNDEGINFDAFAKGAREVYFSPLRAGFLQIGKITLVDAFGRFVDLKSPNPNIVSENLTASQTAPDAHGIYLAPRLVQPTRVNFDWIAAETTGSSSFRELGDEPTVSPICGWIWPNHLDDSLMLYDATGRPMGSLRTRVTKLHWFPVPGETTDPTALNRDQMLAYFAAKSANPVFSDFVSKYLYPDDGPATDTKFQNVLEVLRKSQQFIVTVAMQQDQALSMFMGRPLVIAQTTISLEQKGLPIVGLNSLTYPQWNGAGPQFTLTASNYIPYDFANFNQGGVPELKAPVRIGVAEVQRKGGAISIPYYDDGVAGYFLAEEWGTLYTPTHVANSSGIVSVAASGDHPLSLTPNGAQATLTLVMDPRAAVHATTGLLPVKSLTIPPDQFARTLDDLEITFLTAPLLVTQAPPKIPLPAEQDYGWSWIEVGAEAAPLRPAQGATNVVVQQTPQRLIDGWLKLGKRTTA